MIRLKRFCEWMRVIRRYYSHPTFLRADLSLIGRYLWKNPYTVCRQHGHIYGDTPLTTLAKIAQECDITENDTVYELGCGTGITSIWLRLFTGCTVRGVDCIPTFIANAQAVSEQIDRLSFIQANMLEADYTDATVIYLYGTCLRDPEIEKLTARLQTLPKGVRIITVSYELNAFPLVRSFPARFTWGTANVYLHLT